MTHAFLWSRLRKCYADTNLDDLIPLLKKYGPTSVPDTKRGDQGWVLFADGSEIKWDWDDGLFTLKNDERLEYPYLSEDPLFWDYSHQKTQV